MILSPIGKANRPLTSYALHSLFIGKSVNTPAFLLAALKLEGLVFSDADNPRYYKDVPPEPFMAEIKTLIASGTDLKAKVVITGKGVTKPSAKIIDDIPVIIPQTEYLSLSFLLEICPLFSFGS